LSLSLVYILILYYKTRFNRIILSNRSKYQISFKYKFINISKIYKCKLLIKLIFSIDFKFVFSKKIVFIFALVEYLKSTQYTLNC